MADQQLLDLLKQGSEVWNAWREAHPNIQPDLSYTDFNEYEQLSHANLSGINLSYSYLENADLYQTNLSQTRLKGSNLGNAIFSQADLSGTDLSECYLCQSSFNGANLAGADLKGSNLQEADLRGANLTAVQLQRANLSHVNLAQANLSYASVEGTIFGDVDLRFVEGLEKVKHLGPSLISTSTLSRSQCTIPETFLRQAGLDNRLITALQSLASNSSKYFTCLLSYSSLDQDFAELLFADLQRQGICCWATSHPESMNDDMHPEIAPTHVYDKLILILSKHSIESWWARYEAVDAYVKGLNQDKTVLIMMQLDSTISLSWMADRCRGYPFYNFTHWENSNDYQQAFTTLLHTLQQED